MMSPPSFKLIAHHQRSHNLALTLPFLIGALGEPPGQAFTDEPSAEQALLALLVQLRDQTPESHLARLFQCPKLKQPVVSVTSSFYSPSYAAWGIEPPAGTRLHIDARYQGSSNTVDSAVEQLWQEMKMPLMGGRFSFRNGAYRSFDESDKVFIASALSHDEENEL